ncbi:MAG TPA: hypothetical protein VIZ61_08600 [Solirubrobacterales bacterium]
MAIRLGIAGMGYWGPNLARNLATLDTCELAWCCELDDANTVLEALQASLDADGAPVSVSAPIDTGRPGIHAGP